MKQDLQLREEDLQIDIKPSDFGGQLVCVTHMPSGESAQMEPVQSVPKAIELLSKKLYLRLRGGH